MTAKNLAGRIAGALAAALTIGGLVGVGTAAAVDHSDLPQEHAGATWSFTGHDIDDGGATTNGATWS